MRTWTSKYRSELAARKRDGREMKIEKTENKTQGRPLLLPKMLDQEVQEYLIELRAKGSVVHIAIVISCAEGIVKNSNSCLLQINDGHISFTRHWARHLLSRMGFVKRRISTKAVEEFDSSISS